MPDSVTNASNTVGFIDLSELDSERKTKISIDLLQDALQALEVLNGSRYNEGHLHLVNPFDEDVENPSLALSTDASGDVAVMVAPRTEDSDA